MIKIIEYALNLYNCICSDLNKRSKLKELSSIFHECQFFKNIVPNFFAYKVPVDFQAIILHYKSIIQKTTDSNFIKLIMCECRYNKVLFQEKIVSANINFNIKKLDIGHTNIIFQDLKKIEYRCFSFFLKRIEFLSGLNYNDNLNNIYENEFSYITLLITDINRLKKIISAKKKELDSSKNSVIEVHFQIIDFLVNLKSMIIHKVETNIALKESSIQYFEAVKNDQKSSIFENSTNNFMKDLLKSTKSKLIELNQIFNERIDVNSVNLDDKIQNKLSRINGIVFDVSKLNFLDLNIDTFLNIYIYYIYLRDVFFLEQNKLKNIVLEQNDLEKTIELKSSVINNILSAIYVQKSLLNSLINDFSVIFCKNNLRRKNFKDFYSKYPILKDFICVEIFYDELMDLDLSDNNCLEHYLGFIVNRNKILKLLEINSKFCSEIFNNNFTFFKIQCILVLRLRPLFLYEHFICKKINHVKFHKFLNELVKDFETLICENNDIDENNKFKINFLMLIIEKLKKTINDLNVLMQSQINNKFKEWIKDLVISDLELCNNLFESEYYKKSTINSSILKSKSINCEKTTSGVIDLNSQIVEKVNCNLQKVDQEFVSSTNVKCIKPKTYWQNRWKITENHILELHKECNKNFIDNFKVSEDDED
ncbi:hypothetical protein NUSPORA_01886 [Nucleospora cyclopteri]